jgi:hypothetical protein
MKINIPSPEINKSQESIIILPINSQLITMGVSHYNLAIYMKTYLKAKEELWKLKYFTMQKYNLQKIFQKEIIFFKI